MLVFISLLPYLYFQAIECSISFMNRYSSKLGKLSLPLGRGYQKEKLPTPGQKVGGWVERVFTQKVILRKF